MPLAAALALAGAGLLSGVAAAPALADPAPSSGQVSIQPAGPPELTAATSPDQAVVATAGRIGFRVTVSNSGGSPATNVVVSDSLPAVSGVAWAADPAPDGSTCTVSGTVMRCTVPQLADGSALAFHVVSTPVPTHCTASSVTNSVSAVADSLRSSSASASSRLTCVLAEVVGPVGVASSPGPSAASTPAASSSSSAAQPGASSASPGTATASAGAGPTGTSAAGTPAAAPVGPQLAFTGGDNGQLAGAASACILAGGLLVRRARRVSRFRRGRVSALRRR
ncbi:MAG TPA: hypothetical protein VFH45_11080 [Acidimicrobiales bacterium]|nr:hypothetical protein [Acidimicrobiales bacterium]